MKDSRGKLTAIAAAAVVAVAAPARADERADLEVGFTTAAPGAPTGLTLKAEYKDPSDPNAKPPALEGAAFDLPPGTRIDSESFPRCLATDAEIRSRGRHACPPETKIADGRLVAITGAGPPVDPFDGEAVFFNGEGQIIEIVLVRGSDESAGFDRITIEGSTLVAHPPVIPGAPPDGRTSVRRVEMIAPARVENGRSYFTTPSACPSSGAWRAAGRFKFADGGATTVFADAACRPPGLALRVAPAAVRSGRRATLRVRVTSPVAGCAGGVTVRLGRATARTDAGGRALVRKFLSKRRAVTVRAAKPGCGRATATVRVG